MAGKARQQQLARKKARKQAEMLTPGGKSKYARKQEYLHSTGKLAVQVPSPKPWR